MKEIYEEKNLGAQTWLYPMPVLIMATYDNNGTPDAMNAAWGGICDYKKILFSLAEGHKTYKNMMSRRAFTVSIGDVAHVVSEDCVGLVSGNKVPDKFAKPSWLPVSQPCAMHLPTKVTNGYIVSYAPAVFISRATFSRVSKCL